MAGYEVHRPPNPTPGDGFSEELVHRFLVPAGELSAMHSADSGNQAGGFRAVGFRSRWQAIQPLITLPKPCPRIPCTHLRPKYILFGYMDP